jgi:DNA-binding NarL/FixJ family response regulator
MKRVLAADDHSIVLTGIRNLIEREYELVGQAMDGRSLVNEALRLRPDLVLLDIGMPLLNGIEAAKQIKRAWPEAKLLFVSMHANAMYLREAMRTGASGYVLKSSASEELLPAMKQALKGQIYISPAFGSEVLENFRHDAPTKPRAAAGLTGRQREVLQLIAEGHSNKEVAAILRVSVKTAEFHRARIMRQLGLYSSAELAAFAVREGLVTE